jgi:hypothetical protein
MAHGINPRIEAMKPAVGFPSLDAGPAEPELEQLTQCDHSVLARREFRDCPAG